MNVLTLDLGGTAIKHALFHEDGRLIARGETASDGRLSADALLMRAHEVIGGYEGFHAIGVSTTGQVDARTGEIVFANENVPGYTGVKLRALLEARYGVPVCLIVRANPDTRFVWGGTLRIPERCGVEPEAKVQEPKPRWAYTEYVVQPDDTLYGVALRSGLTMRIVQKANAMGCAAELQPGTVLRLPEIRGARYCVREGERIADIAAKHGVTERALRNRNFIGPAESVRPGACLLV